MALVEPPMALSTTMAFSNEYDNEKFFGEYAKMSRMVAGISAEPGSASPNASAIHCIVLAVPRNVQAPQEGHPVFL